VPIKAFRRAKVRLAPVLATTEREALAREMAAAVLSAAGRLPTWVVCDDPEVAEWAEQQGATVIWTPARGLNAAVEEGLAQLAAAGLELVVVAHADMPMVSSLEGVGRRGTVVLAPDRRRDGTNVAALPARSGFRFSYGPGSFARHSAEAARVGLPLLVLERPDLAWDVDVPDDLDYEESRCRP
jgi:2-phospho-L-lactate guanylyltransferase